MRTLHGLIIFGASIIAGICLRQIDINAYNDKIATSAAMICDVIQVRAQGGSTRDVHDQVFSFLRQRSPDPRSSVVVKNGMHEIGSLLSGEDSDVIQSNCAIDGAPDYKMTMTFHKMPLMDLKLFEYTFGFFAIFMLAFLLLRRLLKFIAKLWSKELLSSLRAELGLHAVDSVAPVSLKTIFSSKVGSWMSMRLGSVKEEIRKLKNEIDEKNKSLQATQNVILSQNQSLAKATSFESKVRMVKHDLKGPLSAMKFAIYNRTAEREVLPEIISTIEKIVMDLESDAPVAEVDVAGSTSTEILEVIAKEATARKRSELGNNSTVEIFFDYQEVALSPVAVRPDYLERVFSNLLQNAVEAIGDAKGNIFVKIFHDGGNVKVEVTDTGKGIPTQVMPNLFKQGGTFGKSTGTGLGLHFVKSCLNAWGGDIVVGATGSAGTTFVLTLPLIAALNGLFVGPSLIKPSEEMILVDDEADQMKLLWHRTDAHCYTTPQGFIEWWESAGKESTGHLVVDMHLSKHINGLDILREVGKRARTYISTSDFLNTEIIETVGSLGVKIIPKPLLG